MVKTVLVQIQASAQPLRVGSQILRFEETFRMLGFLCAASVFFVSLWWCFCH